ncbi:MAG TPA: hypothetical protein DCS43_15370 [Verrucomicrobia bacterium]|nr:hypothetical protein [Verrucomicrobiota bacterium]
MIAEPILNALLHLFAMTAARLDGDKRQSVRKKVLAYLNNHVGLSDADVYIGLYEGLTEVQAEVQENAPEATLLQRATEIAQRLKPLLHGFEKYAALIRFLEIGALVPDDALPRKIASLLSDTLGLDPSLANAIRAFIADPEKASVACENVKVFGGDKEGCFQGRFAAFFLPGTDIFLISPLGDAPIRLEGRPLERGHCQPLRRGHVLRDHRGHEIYFAHLATAFEQNADRHSLITFQGRHLDYRFPHSDNGLHNFSFTERGGRMVAVMGASGSGKSTLLGILNGTIRPDSGALLLNSHNVYTQPKAVEGVIGFVPQDDLLFEDLTVFENLYYAARLCMAHLPEDELVQRVRSLLEDLGQAGAADLKVGSPLQKTISGGQRKRLNIALELIREPTVLFVDEPTSGLSSTDSETVMSLLRELAVRGKLVFVVIHQPSSIIFRMFDALWVLDQGGWPIFKGTPLEAVTYFRSQAALPGAGESICPDCGGVNPEQIFDIIEARTMDKSGQYTRERRISPERWHALYQNYAEGKEHPEHDDVEIAPSPVEKCLARPSHWGQLKIFFMRDVRSRLANRQYVLINLLEPLILGLLIGFVSRGAHGSNYSFHNNNNVHVFFFMSVMVSLFLGLSVSAEEICRDGKILRRERFLHLSWWSYINAKTLYVAMVAAIQMLLYVSIANWIVAVPEYHCKTWLTLFLCAFCSSLLGLNISAALRSAVTIYILIPLLLIPQMLLCGVVIKYDDLIAPHSRRREVPRYANLLPPRWGYEALIVEQYAKNAYMQHFFDADAALRLAEYDLDYYLPEIQNRIQSIALLRGSGKSDPMMENLSIIQNELDSLSRKTGTLHGLRKEDFTPERFNDDLAQQATAFIAESRRHIFEDRRKAAGDKRSIEARLEQTLTREGLAELKKTHTNRSIQEQVLNLRDMEPIGSARDGLTHKTLPIYRTPESPWGEAHFLAGDKRFLGHVVRTFHFNHLATILLSAFLYLALKTKAISRVFKI